jgi:hypothetical protein
VSATVTAPMDIYVDFDGHDMWLAAELDFAYYKAFEPTKSDAFDFRVFIGNSVSVSLGWQVAEYIFSNESIRSELVKFAANPKHRGEPRESAVVISFPTDQS